MENRQIKFLSLFLVLAIILTSSAIAFADEKKCDLSDELIARVVAFVNDTAEDDIERTVKNYIVINGFCLEDKYVLFSFNPSGYAFCDTESGVIEEFMPLGDNPYLKYTGEFFYGGPMNYVLKKENRFYLLEPYKELTVEDIEAMTINEERIRQSRNNIMAIPDETNYYYMSNSSYFTNLIGNNYGTNDNGSCVQVACELLLGFYDNYVSNSYVADTYRSGYGVTNSFHNLLQYIMGYGGISFPVAKAGLKTYLEDERSIYFVGIYNSPSLSVSGVLGKVDYNVNRNRPTIIGMSTSFSSSCPYDHAVVAYGYREEISSFTSSITYYVHTGWKNNPIASFSGDWFQEYLYLS